MSDHYYTKEPTSTSNPEQFKEVVIGQALSLTSDAGVFSRGQMDFGTRTLIEAVQTDKKCSGPLLDMGCGYGVVGIALAAANPERTIHMVDINERAVALAKQNAEVNAVENVIIQQSSLFENIVERSFSAVVSNPPIRAGKQVVHGILEQSYDYLQPGGKLYIVIQKKQGAPSAKKKMQAVFGNVERIALEKGYWVLMAEK